MTTTDQNRRRAYFALAVLFAINTMNFYDRQITAAVTEPIRKEWNLTYFQIGMLGTAFTLIYAAVGVPLGRLADRSSRTRILSLGVTVWSLLTAASGLTWNYGSMFATRLGVGIGEASCAPASNSLVGDLFPPRQRARALSIFMLGLPIGILLSSWVSGWLAGHVSWRAAFFIACIPGLLCAVLTLFVPEPVRGSCEHDAPSVPTADRPQRPGSPYLVVLGTPTILWIIVSGALHNFNMYAVNTFLPALIKLRHERSDSEAGFIAGIVLGAVGVFGLLGGGWVADRVQRTRRNGRLLVASLALFLSVPCVYLGLEAPPGSIGGFIIFTGTGVLLMYVYYAGVYAAIQDVIEPGMRATAMALYFFAMYVFGGSFGSSITGWLGDVLARNAMIAARGSANTGPIPDEFRAIGLHQAFYVVPVLCLVLSAVLFAASRTVAGDMKKLADWYARSAHEVSPAAIPVETS